MSSESFENFEYELEDVAKSISKKLGGQLPNYTGEQRKSCINAIAKEIDRANELVRDMEMEARSAPPSARARMSSRIKGYQTDVQKHQRDLKAARTSGGAGGRDELLGGDSWGSSGEQQRGRLLDSQTTLDRTSARITNTQRIADETEQIGSGVLTELGSQRDTIVRVAHKVQGVDANLSKSKRILNGMSRRVMTNQVTMIIIIFVLCAILGIVIWSKLK